jgi:parvulin-like peptidyl-prolyl isomerase
MFRFTSIALMLFFAAMCLMASAQQNPPSPSAAQPAAPPSAQPPAKPAATESNVVVARVSGEPVTEKQVLGAIQDLASRRIVLTPEQQKQQNTLLFKGAMDNLITSILLKNEARKLNVTVDKAKVDQQMKEFAGRYPSQDEFQKAMASQGFTEAEVRKSVEESLSMQEVINLAVKDVPGASDEQIQNFYDSNPDKFPIPEKAHLAQIFIRVEPSSTTEQKAAARKKIEEIRADIESKKITFADAAVKFSQDAATAPKGGDLGFISRTGRVKPVEDVVFGTAVGSMTPVIEDQSGFSFVQVIELKPAGKATLEEAKPAIKQFLDQSARQKALQKYIEDLKSKAVVENFMTAEEFDKRHPMQ